MEYDMIIEKILPSSCWAENDDSHCLMIDLPGFKQEEVRIRAGYNYDNIVVSGERQTNDNKIIHFEQSFVVPQACNIEDASGILEDHIFYVTLPKRHSTREQEIPRIQDSTYLIKKEETLNKEATSQEDEEKEEENGRTDSAEESSNSSLFDKISKNLKKTRLFVLTTFLAFSLGVVVSNYHHSTKQKSKDSKKG